MGGNIFNSKKVKSIYYCFEIKYLCGKELFLTSNDQPVNINDINYNSLSGLSLKELNLTDSGLSMAILHGIFEAGGITRDSQISGARIAIKTVNDQQQLRDLITLYVTKFDQNELDFHLECESEAIKYNQSLLKIYSQTCRANFGDQLCGIDMNKFARELQISKMEGNIITCKNLDQDNNYFKLGTAIFKVNDTGNLLHFKYKINASYRDTIELAGLPALEIQRARTVTIIPGCDKEFTTCHQKYGNNINFRGEPFIPDDKVLSS